MANPQSTGLSVTAESELRAHAAQIRLLLIESIYYAQSGHPGGSLSVADILTYLYFYKMNIDPTNPKWEQRDRFVLSKGHCAPALYATLALKGFFSTDELNNLRKTGQMLQGHPDAKKILGVDMSTGSLGQGFSAACGMALAAKKTNSDYRTYAIVGDGELQEGQIWEAAMFASYQQLDNLTVLIDYNNLQISGSVSDTLEVMPIDQKFEAFGWETYIVDGHDFYEIDNAISDLVTKQKPSAVICKTIKGKGVSFMENNFSWHGAPPNKEQFIQAQTELLSQFNSGQQDNVLRGQEK